MDDKPAKTYGDRLRKAMKHGGFTTDSSLAKKLTAELIADGLLTPDKEIPQQTIQSARTRITDKGSSKYNSYIARLCRVDPMWLLNGVGDMLQKNARDKGSWPFEFDELRFLRLSPPEKRKIERLVLTMIEDFETDRSISKPKKKKGQGT